MENSAVSVMNSLEELAKERGHIDPHTWLEGAVKLAALLHTESDKLAEIEHRLAKMKAAYVEEGQTAAAAKMMVEADDLHLEFLKLTALIKRGDKIMQMANKFATVSKDLMIHNL